MSKPLDKDAIRTLVRVLTYQGISVHAHEEIRDHVKAIVNHYDRLKGDSGDWIVISDAAARSRTEWAERFLAEHGVETFDVKDFDPTGVDLPEDMPTAQEVLAKIEAEQLGQAKRCRRCGWPIASAVEDGCTIENCSQRPLPPIKN